MKSLPPLSLNAWLRWDVVRRALDELDEAGSILEIGTGLGAMSARLALRHEYVGVELDPTSFAVAEARLAELGRGEVLHGDLSAVDPRRRFDVVCAFEVLEHLGDDVGALREWVERLEPGGTAIVSVPAWQRQWGPHDVHAGHFRRYDREPLLALLTAAGLGDPRLYAYGFPVGYALQAARNVLARRTATEAPVDATAASGRWLQPPDALAGATRVASAPFRLLQRPFAGSDLATGWVATGRREARAVP
jgi:SAM-dependent methyltransferase